MQRKKETGKRVFCLFLTLLLVGGGLLHLLLLFSPIASLARGETDFSRFTGQIKEAYTERLVGKEVLVELGGAYARVLGRRSYHGVSVLQNGMLDHDALESLDTTPLFEEILALRDDLAACDIPLLYVQVPCKMDADKSLRGVGQTHYGVENADALLGQLRGRVETLDLRPYFTDRVSTVERYFYRTDHHWNADGAFLASRLLLERISLLLECEVELSRLAESEWERRVYPNWFLGSHGKRVGRFFGGLDDLVVYTPRFEAHMKMEIPLHNIVLEGAFEETVLKKEYLDAPDYFGENPHVVYVGGDYPAVFHTNESSLNDLSVLLIKDSFSLPVQAFLSTTIRRLDVIDPRYLRGERVGDYIEKGNYDVVVMMINPSVFGDARYQRLLKSN